ncbi:MAG: hypothetical protein LBG81_08175, partial [Coriobacteriaceae bacterium]|nr:hypothetical protein [Coriobacteriaceae bacterium]
MLAPAREKIALLGFSVLILIGMGFLVGYLAIGHSWNVAASNIDDAAGSMDGYITILYEGVVPLKEKPGAATTSPNASSNPSLPGSTV